MSRPPVRLNRVPVRSHEQERAKRRMSTSEKNQARSPTVPKHAELDMPIHTRPAGRVRRPHGRRMGGSEEVICPSLSPSTKTGNMTINMRRRLAGFALEFRPSGLEAVDRNGLEFCARVEQFVAAC